jgi:dihydrofolate reductase
MKKPKVILVMAMSADGYITRHEDGLVDWTSKEDKKHFVAVTKKAGAIIYGGKTFATFAKPLPNRLNVVMTRKPDISQNQEGLLEFTNQDPDVILEDLANRGYEEVALGGGAVVNKLFFQKNLVDEISLSIEPRLFGSGKRLVDELHMDIKLELLENKLLNDNTILLRYKVLQ